MTGWFWRSHSRLALWGFGLVFSLFIQTTLNTAGWAQQLDLDFLKAVPPAKPRVMALPDRPSAPVNPAALPAGQESAGQEPAGEFSMGKPLTASVSKTLYLPPAMYGQWTVTGIVKETNISDLVPVANDLWILQRQGDEVIITNPVNGASASIQVDAVEGNTATFHRSGQSAKAIRSETVTLTVNGDTLYGRNMRKEEIIRKGQVVKVNYALFELQGTRIGGARAIFRPQAVEEGPDIEIDDVKRAQ